MTAFGLTKTYKISDKKGLVNKTLMEDLVNTETGEVIEESGMIITDNKLDEWKKAGITKLTVAAKEESMEVQILKNTME